MIDYSAASTTYDHTRSHSDVILDRFVARLSLDQSVAVLDFGCGTGNYLLQLHQRYGCQCFGVEPSDGMRTRALSKSKHLTVENGSHLAIPFGPSMFDFAYMTDVIHHVPDTDAMFAELARVLRAKAPLCVVTESHSQIDGRFYNRFFPSLAKIEKSRYPDIQSIIASANAAGFSSLACESIPAPPRTISEEFIRNAHEKNWSMFRLLSNTEFDAGLSALAAHIDQSIESPRAGTTLLWLSKDAEPLDPGDAREAALLGSLASLGHP
ncbi:MAG: methyltransferase domain-containing protein [Sterolibacterium sp.]|jgi:ubiquinone/menaquinone biosynthesis C-methylase UbiE